VSRPGLLEGAAVAFATSVLGSGAFALLAPVVGRADALHAVIAGVSLAYLLYLVVRSRVRAGRAAVPAAWALLTFALALADAAPGVQLLAHAALVALARSLCFHRGVVPVIADLAVAAAGLAAGAWAVQQGAGVALAIWSLMLVQSLFVLIPSRPGPGAIHRAPAGDADAFLRAHRAAEAAVRRLCAGA
jgi:hypothetical protein